MKRPTWPPLAARLGSDFAAFRVAVWGGLSRAAAEAEDREWMGDAPPLSAHERAMRLACDADFAYHGREPLVWRAGADVWRELLTTHAVMAYAAFDSTARLLLFGWPLECDWHAAPDALTLVPASATGATTRLDPHAACGPSPAGARFCVVCGQPLTGD